MKNKLSPRLPPISAKWKKLVFKWADVEQTKRNNAYLNGLWLRGYSHKNASIKLAVFNSYL